MRENGCLSKEPSLFIRFFFLSFWKACPGPKEKDLAGRKNTGKKNPLQQTEVRLYSKILPK
jgi:hypothetical protein